MSAVPFQAQQRFGQYVLQRPIAQGGMAEVWLAKLDGPQGFQKKVALKRMTGTLAEQPQFVTMFLDEARLMAGLTHPNICQVFELGEREESFYVAMEFIDGQTVQHVMRAVTRAQQRLPVELAVKIARDAADALQYAHTRVDDEGRPLNIIHRDVSPQNLMVTYEGVPKLLDFGIAKAATRSNATEAGQLRGKLSYMPPEQARGEALDARADQFALGVTLFEMLTHTRLYPALKEMDLFRAVALGTEAYETPQQRDPSVPDELNALVAQMMARDPAQRLASMAEVRDRLTIFLHGISQSMATQGAVRAERVGNEALAQFMTSLFPPEAREKLTSLSSPSLPIIAGEFSSSLPRQRRLRMVGLTALALVGVTALGVALWPSDAPAPRPVDVAVVAPPPPKPELPEPPPVVDAGAVVAELDLTDVVPPPPPIDAGAPSKVPNKRAVVVKGKGFLSLQTTPWSNVYFGKTNLGETPLVRAQLPAGKQRLTLVNEERKLRTTIEVDIKPNETTTMKLKL